MVSFARVMGSCASCDELRFRSRRERPRGREVRSVLVAPENAMSPAVPSRDRSLVYSFAFRLGLASVVLAGCAPEPAEVVGSDARPTTVAAVAAPTSIAPQRLSRITLVTGDRVLLSQADGREPAIAVEPGPGRDQVGFVSRVTHDRGVENVIVL